MARQNAFTPATVDDLIRGRMSDPLTPGLGIEVLGSGKKRWDYRRRLPGADVTVKMWLGLYPAYNIAAARDWAGKLNEQVEAGVDPREAIRAEEAREIMTVDRAHQLYMVAVREGRSSRAKRRNKPRTIADKLEIYERDIRPNLGTKIIYEVTEAELVKLVTAKGKVGRKNGGWFLVPAFAVQSHGDFSATWPHKAGLPSRWHRRPKPWRLSFSRVTIPCQAWLSRKAW